AHIDVRDLDKLGEELGKMGEDIGKEMEGLGGDVDQWSKGFAKLGSSWPGWGGRGHDGDDNDRDDDGEAPTATVTSGTTESSDSDSDDGDDEDIARGIGDLGLQPPQREAIQRLRADTDRQIAAAKAALKASSHALRDLLAHPGASDADIARAIDTVSQQEATIRKARILAWVNARRLLDDAQRARVEAATHRSH
ncbi:MAG TPA: hypothetical protein VLX92_09600, partial [Kofleriaceae bacterium]|nr:hypothetical protein [Kofleriaceae bacterium]